MISTPDSIERLFQEAEQNWDLERLYADLEALNGKQLKPFEKACLRGLLCRYRPGQIAFKLAWTSGSLRVELNKGLYRYIEALAERPANTLKWESISEWLDAKGYKLQQVARAGSQHISDATDWGEAPEVPIFFGRAEELTELERWITSDRCRLLALWGMGGIGKTAIAVKLAERIYSQFDAFVWRSLRHVQPIPQLIADWSQALAPSLEPRDDLPALMEILRTKRCLLVLDDFETILRDGELVGPYRQGCEGYAELLQRVGGERHQSCLVLISREQPKEVAMLQGEGLATRSLKLGGLERQGARQLLKARGFSGSEGGIESLVQQYRGNPAALKIVAMTIQELFNGNISEFLKQTQLALGDILRSLLYEQFERLSDLEKNVLYWLALKRRPVSLNNLREDMEQYASGSELLNALESLRWRSLIEKNTEKNEVLFMLEPVVLKYVNKKFIDEVCKEVQAMVKARSLAELRLLRNHPLVEDRAQDSIRAVQIRLTLKPIKDKLAEALAQAGITKDTLNDVFTISRSKQPEASGYLEANMTLLGLWL